MIHVPLRIKHIAWSRCSIALRLHHGYLEHNLLKTGNLLSKLILLRLHSSDLIVHALDRRIELIDLIEGQLE